MIWILIVILTGLVLSFYLFLTWNFDYWFKLGVPSPVTRVLFGDLPNELLRRQHADVSHDIQKIYDEFKGKTPYVGFIRVRWPQILILEPEIVKDILIRNFNSFCNTENSYFINHLEDKILSQSLFGLKGETWKEKRAEILPVMTRLKNVSPKIEEVVRKFIPFEIEEKNEAVEVKKLSTKILCEVTARTIYGNSNANIEELASRMSTKISHKNLIKILLISAFPFLKKYIRVHSFDSESEENYLKLLNNEKECDEKQNSFLDYLMYLKTIKKTIRDIDIASHSIPFLSHGIEYSSHAISYSLYEIAKNQRVQEKLRDEINQHLSKNTTTISLEVLNEMTYLDQVFFEALRLHPTVSLISRVCNETISIQFENSRLTIEKGINVCVPIMQIQNDTNIFIEPRRFHPERFNNSLKACLDNCVLMPFGCGPRACLGSKFASMQCKIVIATIIKYFILTINEKSQENHPKTINRYSHETLDLNDGLWLNFETITKFSSN